MSKAYSLTQADLLVLIENIKSRRGSLYTIKMVRLEQSNNYTMFVGKMAIDTTYALLRRIPRDYDNPNGIQRALKESKVNNIARMVAEDSRRYSSPNAVVLTLDTELEYVSLEEDPVDSEIAYYKVDLDKLETVVREAEVDSDGYLEDESIFPGILIDGHHRTAGLYDSGKMSFECPVTVYIDLPSKDTAKVFADINVYQEKPSAVHSLAMKAIAGTLSSTEETAHHIVNLLNTEDWSILKYRVKDIDGKRPKDLPKPYITNSTFVTLVEKMVLDYLPEVGVLRKAQILNDYFTAWSNVYPEAWQDEKTHVLVKSMGFQIMLRLFREIFIRTSLTKTPATEDFEEFLKDYLNPGDELEVHGKILAMNWNSPDFGGYSSGKGISDITAALHRHISQMHFANQSS